MQLSIIPSDWAVYEDGLCYAGLTWEGTPSNVHALQFNSDSNTGWIEFNDGTQNESITAVPTWGQNAEAAWQVAYDEAHQPPTPPTYDEKYNAMLIERDKRLLASDYTQLPDVIDLHNQSWLDQWVDYRQQLRDLPNNVNPENIDNIPWPVPPAE